MREKDPLRIIGTGGRIFLGAVRAAFAKPETPDSQDQSIPQEFSDQGKLHWKTARAEAKKKFKRCLRALNTNPRKPFDFDPTVDRLILSALHSRLTLIQIQRDIDNHMYRLNSTIKEKDLNITDEQLKQARRANLLSLTSADVPEEIRENIDNLCNKAAWQIFSLFLPPGPPEDPAVAKAIKPLYLELKTLVGNLKETTSQEPT